MRLSEERRIFDYNWDHYDTAHVVFKPKNMLPEELYEGYKFSYKETFKFSQILKRSAGFRYSNIINFLGNVNYKKFSRRINKCRT